MLPIGGMQVPERCRGNGLSGFEAVFAMEAPPALYFFASQSCRISSHLLAVKDSCTTVGPVSCSWVGPPHPGSTPTLSLIHI